jgi:putative transposase
VWFTGVLHLKLSVRLVIQTACASGKVPDEIPLPPSTVHRLLVRHGLMQKTESHSTERRRNL